MQRDETRFCPFRCSFCNVPSFISCFGSPSCSMPPYSHASAISSLSPALSACALVTTEIRILTHPLHTDTQKPMSHPCTTHFSPAPFPTNSFAHALPPEQERSAASFLTEKRTRGGTARSTFNSTLNVNQERLPGVEVKIQLNIDTMQ